MGGATAYLGGATAYLVGGATAYLGGATAYLVGGLTVIIGLVSVQVTLKLELPTGTELGNTLLSSDYSRISRGT